MNGKDYALIQVHIANGGEDAYKPDEFGETIVAEHRIERQGAGYYKLRDGLDGISRKSSHKEFIDMCAHFNIQANNPCALLTQEHAKKFLHQGNEEDRYRFFLQVRAKRERHWPRERHWQRAKWTAPPQDRARFRRPASPPAPPPPHV